LVWRRQSLQQTLALAIGIVMKWWGMALLVVDNRTESHGTIERRMLIDKTRQFG